MKPYSYDIRKRILNHSLNNPVSETARLFDVSINTVYLIKRLFCETGDVKPLASSRQYSRLISSEGELYLQVLIIEKPDITLEELRHEYQQAYGVKVSIGTMFNTLKRLGFSYKKTFSDPCKAQPGSQKLRDDYEKKIEKIALVNRVYLDETGACINMTLPYGRARRGEPVHEQKSTHTGERLNTIALLSETGVCGGYHYPGSLDAQQFMFYLEYVALPLLKDEQVLIMDRHPVHCARAVREFLRNNHVNYLYLPPYSPELNPIEEMFSKIKHYIKKCKPRTLSTLLRTIKESLQTVTLQDIMGYFNHSNSFIINAY